MELPVVEVIKVSKKFKLYRSPSDRLKEILFRKPYHRSHMALKDISFTVGSSEILGIIGQNGAGKSTLLKILMKVLMPDSGIVNIRGRVTGLLELGTGFNYEFSGIDNIFFNGSFLGMSRKDITSRLNDIIAFSELEDFIYEPMKTYSSGMVMRLAFSIAIHADPKVFLVDEALSVGDLYFQQKCIRKIKEFKEKGGSIIFVSHDLNAVKLLCDKAILMEQGRVIEKGDPEDVINTYNFIIARKSEGGGVEASDSVSSDYGNFRVRIVNVEVTDENGCPITSISSGKPCVVRVHLVIHDDLDDLTVGILFRDRFGQDIFGVSTFYAYGNISAQKGETLVVAWSFPELNIGIGHYSLSVAAHKGNVHINECYHWIDKAAFIEVLPPEDSFFVGLVRLKPEVRVERVAIGAENV